ncbi:maleylpyruvate isomerase N-terminal domain-containing protein [Actinomadura parmotrematis]|uniref:Maleylpyruvate isomerase N-terminal domain-containing protein n=1 Tax=Actinomadura parmotrematis TaxID=2864039 RepID=A0ABS7FKE6_9ACTN|nr:maleylpyruvate isomerase N-terminal domain-containing protein [Actinomadura parmotrematis]MBW8480831.1 maleylpyruvate isomerase N-terminal domain-containing protein [Actinomadura parmotrematis]
MSEALPPDATWDHARYCAATAAEIAAFGAAARGADPAAPVPTTPGWDVAALVRHLGGTHRWAGGLVATRADRATGRRALGVTFPDDDAALFPWYDEGGVALLDTLRGTPPETPVWTWGSGGDAAWWARRMLHETAVHRADAELAAGARPVVDTAVAVDGVSELLANLPAAAAFAPAIKELGGDGGTIALTAADAGARWTIRLRPEGFTWERADGADGADGSADAEIRAAASDLYLLLWRRRDPADGAAVEGDRALVDRWLAHAAF